jgi:gluconate kinase
LLASQFDSLEEPVDAINIDASLPEIEIVKQIELALRPPKTDVG